MATSVIALTLLAMNTPRRHYTLEQVMFAGLAVILTALLVYFGVSSIPGSLRPTLQSTPAITAATMSPAITAATMSPAMTTATP